MAGLATFVRAVELGSFSAAARQLRMTPSAVSKAVARLEDRLGVLLLKRSTRRLVLTVDGDALFERGTRIVAELRAAEDELREAKGPRGRLRITAPIDLGRHWLVPVLQRFDARYPAVRCELHLGDSFVDLAHDGLDVAVRMGEHAAPETVRRKLGQTSSMVCATPGYLRKRGTPRAPADLRRHDCLVYCRGGAPVAWRFGDEAVEVSGSFAANNNDVLLAMALAHRGVVRLPSFMAGPCIADGKLRVLFDGQRYPGPMAYVVYPERRHLAPRVKAFGDFVSQAFAKQPV